MCGSRVQKFLILLFLISVSSSCGDEPTAELKVSQDNPKPDQPFVVFLQPDFDNHFIAPAQIPANTYNWTVAVDPTNVALPKSVNEPGLKFNVAPQGARFTISLTKKIGNGSTVFGPITVTIGQTAAIGNLNEVADDDLGGRLAADLTELHKVTPQIAAVCREIAKAINTGVEASNNLETLVKEVRANVKTAILTTKNIETPEVKLKWTAAYDKLISERETSLDTFEKRKAAYTIGAEALARFAESLVPEPSSPAAIGTDAFDAESIATKIAEKLNDPPLELIKFDTEFQKTVRLLVVAIEDLMRETIPETATEYKEKTKKAVLDVFGSLEQAKDVQERWRNGYNMFVQAVEQSKNIDANTAKGWDEALLVLVVGLKRSAHIKDTMQEAARRAQGNRAAAAGGSGSSTAGSYSGYGNTIHGVITARRVQRIGNRAAINRARIQRIRGQ